MHVRAAGHPRGTTVEARDLFGEVPARRKFLRADSTETGHVAEAVTLLALAWPQVGFTLTSGGRRVIQAPPADGLPSRLFQLFGGPFVDDLAAVDDEGEGVRVHGFVARPDRPRSARPNLRLFVNGRPVRDRADREGGAPRRIARPEPATTGAMPACSSSCPCTSWT